MKKAVEYLPETFRHADAIKLILLYDERPYPMCPRCENTTTRTFICRKCLKDALAEVENV